MARRTRSKPSLPAKGKLDGWERSEAACHLHPDRPVTPPLTIEERLRTSDTGICG